ncbi:hypothetical protein DE146DRAFT_412517 [Phaeosphaeria sp. MPI-PUGE-AT-0046c]|nr:hypothetical protein DE146DRAFT_412517 [Phaeosphaeria sp. MPI-PUGE-AT-0046c]
MLRHIILQCTAVRIHVASQGHPQICNLLEGPHRAQRWLCVRLMKPASFKNSPLEGGQRRASASFEPTLISGGSLRPHHSMYGDDEGSRRTPRTRFEKVSLCSKPISLALHSQQPRPLVRPTTRNRHVLTCDVVAQIPAVYRVLMAQMVARNGAFTVLGTQPCSYPLPCHIVSVLGRSEMGKRAIGRFCQCLQAVGTPLRSSLVNRRTHLGHYTRRPTGNLLTHLIWHLTNNREAGNFRCLPYISHHIDARINAKPTFSEETINTQIQPQRTNEACV